MSKGRSPAPLPQRVVGVGASAGGLDALKQLVTHLPSESGLAVVILQHLSPSQSGRLAEHLGGETSLPVVDAANGQRVEPNTIYIVPPHTAARLQRGALVLKVAKAGTRPERPIDELFGSLADALGDRAIAVVLSGTGMDGTDGARAIQAAGGLTFAQDPATAQFDEMPRNAIAAGVIEIVVPPATIAQEIGAIAAMVPRDQGQPRGEAIDRVLEKLRRATGIDFASYKRSTMERRLARRIARLELPSLEAYSTYLDEHPDENTAVHEDLLIHVTEFFRDVDVLEKAIDFVVATLVDRPAEQPVRVWVPGCSTGEEVYSLAILLIEKIGSRPFQIFGTDLSERAIATARRGQYPKAIAETIGPERIARFFRSLDGGYRIATEVRERCVFTRHDLISDPPLSKLDLVSCRNLLIYLGAPLQQHVLPLLHYALEYPGHLLLGRAESIGAFDSLFEPVDAEARIFARKPGRRHTTYSFGRTADRVRPSDATRRALDAQREVDHVLLARYAPPCVLVDDNLDILQYRGRTGDYLEAPPGHPQTNLLRMAREGVASAIPLAVQRARKLKLPVRQENLTVHDRGETRRFHLEVVPLHAPDEAAHFLVLFEPAEPDAPPAKAPAKKAKSVPDRGELEHVRDELSATKEYLRSISAQHLATTEELGVANEELQSTNEELQSSNEELQTAKEELQSTNEELETVNEELQRSNGRLREVNDDLVNVLESVAIAIIIVDHDRCVRRFTPKARAVMSLIPGDIGRPIADLRPNVTVAGLDAAIAEVIESLAIHESEVRHTDGTFYRMQIRPYRTTDHRIGGAVITFVDITTLREARDHAAAIVETVPTPLVVLDERLRIRSANRAFWSMFELRDAAGAGRGLLDLGDWSDRFQQALAGVQEHGTPFDAIEVLFRGAIGERVFEVGGRRIVDVDTPAILVGVADITARWQLDRARETAKRERDAFLDALSHELRTPLSAILLWAQALHDMPPDDDRRGRAIETIIESTQAEAKIVDDLLDLATSRTGLAISRESIDAREVIARAVDKLRNAARAKAIDIESVLAEGPPILGDPRRLEQIVHQLVSNAIKFAGDGGHVRVSLARANGAIEIRVTDDGSGIAPDVLPTIFEAFSPGDPSRTRVHYGLGIGLALVRHLVQRQGGTIDVASREHAGSTFTVVLPSS